jgi:hypothetical protein
VGYVKGLISLPPFTLNFKEIKETIVAALSPLEIGVTKVWDESE